MFEISVKRAHAPWENKAFKTSKKRLKSSRGIFGYGGFSDTGDIRIRLHNRFICMGVDTSIYALLTGGRS